MNTQVSCHSTWANSFLLHSLLEVLKLPYCPGKGVLDAGFLGHFSMSDIMRIVSIGFPESGGLPITFIGHNKSYHSIPPILQHFGSAMLGLGQ